MALSNESTAADVKSALIDVIEELPEERVAEVLDFALFIKTRETQTTHSEFTYKQKDLAKTITALQANETHGRLYERLMAERAEERAREYRE